MATGSQGGRTNGAARVNYDAARPPYAERDDRARRFHDAALPFLNDVYTLALYLMRNVDGQWKIFDVRIEGISYVQTFKTQFDAPLRQKGIAEVAKELRDGTLQAGNQAGAKSSGK